MSRQLENQPETDFLTQLLSEVSPTPASYINTARRIEAATETDLKPVRVAMLSSFTAQVIRPYLIVEGARRGLCIAPHFCPFNQFETQVFEPTSELYAAQPNVIVLALRLEEAFPDLATRYTSLSVRQIESAIAEIRQRLEALIKQIRANSSATVLVFNFALPQIADAGFADPTLEIPQSVAVGRLNEAVASLCRGQTGVSVFDYAWLVTRFGSDAWHDSKLAYSARIPLGKEAQLALGRELARCVRAAFFPPAKCLALDLDNTLWGRVLGEEGVGGIALGEEYPGNVFKAFQRRILSLRDQGVLLAIASKNNEADVVEAFNTHADMLLKLEDFAAVQIHWNDKASSLRSIAKELNIGIDAVAFFDDNPVEREWVMRELPEVAVIDAPADPANYIRAIEESGLFDRLVISDEDRRRSALTRETRGRDQLLSRSTSVADFLRELCMVATIGDLAPATLPRIAQLLGKTNQFNLTTRRHTAAQLTDMVDHGAIVLWLRLKDQFGDNGLVGVAIAVPDSDEQWRVDSFLLSCRVIGRQVETALLGVLARRVAERGGRHLIGEYLPTKKNGQVAGFYQAHGFDPQDSEGRLWSLDLRERPLALPDPIQIEYASGDASITDDASEDANG